MRRLNCFFTGRKVSVLLVAFAYLFTLHWKLCVMKRTQPAIWEIQRADFTMTTNDGLYTNIFISMYNQSCLTIRYVSLCLLVNGIAFDKINCFFDHFQQEKERDNHFETSLFATIYFHKYKLSSTNTSLFSILI